MKKPIETSIEVVSAPKLGIDQNENNKFELSDERFPNQNYSKHTKTDNVCVTNSNPESQNFTSKLMTKSNGELFKISEFFPIPLSPIQYSSPLALNDITGKSTTEAKEISGLSKFANALSISTPNPSPTTQNLNGLIRVRDILEMTNDKIADDTSDKKALPANVIKGENENKINLQLQLPPPIPQPPEPGLVLHRGKWIREQKLEKIMEKRLQSKKAEAKKVRRYNWTELTLTGKKLKDTDTNRNMPEGRHECVTCNAVFSHARSLQVHIGRLHNPKATIPCPENCGKFFACKKTIKKHLLSHRPEEEWPYVCLFCGKHMQANHDLAKHLVTKQHANDPRIPKVRTPEWKELMKRSEVQSIFKQDTGNPVKPTTQTSITAAMSALTQPIQFPTSQDAGIKESATQSKIGKGEQNVCLNTVTQSVITYDFEYDTNMKVEEDSDVDIDSIPDFDPDDNSLA